MLTRLTAIIILLTCNYGGNAQDSHSWLRENKDSIHWLGNVFNVGGNFGVGGARLNRISPMPGLKLGPFGLRYLSWMDADINADQHAFQVDWELFSWNKRNPKMRDCFTISSGYISTFNRTRTTKEYGFVIAGVNHYVVQSRWCIGLRAGVGFEDKKTPHPAGHSTIESRNIFYGDVFGTFSLFKYQPNTTIPYWQKQAKTKPSNRQLINPFLSVGLGTDKASYFFPSVGIKLLGFHAQFSLFDLEAYSALLQLDLPYFRVSRTTITKATISLNVFDDYYEQIMGVMYGYIWYVPQKKASFYLRGGLGITEYQEPYPLLSFGLNAYLRKITFESF